MASLSSCSFQEELEAELDKLKRKMKMGYELKVIHTPKIDSKLSGQVKGNFIFVYDMDRDIAIETLKHEFIDYAVSKTIEPYKEISNLLIKLFNKEAYERKENLVELLIKMLD